MGSNGFIWFEVTESSRSATGNLRKCARRLSPTGPPSSSALRSAQRRRACASASPTAKSSRISRPNSSRRRKQSGHYPPQRGRGTRPDRGHGGFLRPQGTVATASGADPSTQILLTVTAVRDQPTGGVPLTDDAQIAQVANAAGDDILDQMVGQLQSEYGVTINQALAQQAIVR